MRKLSIVFLVACAWCFVTNANAVSFPFTLRNDLIWVEVQSSEQGEPLHFLFDTGAEVSILDLSTARRLNVKLGRKEPIQGVHGRMNAYRVARVPATVAGERLPKSMLAFDLSAVSRSVNRRIDGLLGADFFRSSTVRIDYENRRISISRSSNAVTASGTEAIPLRRRGGILCTRMTIEDIPSQWMRVDTGCSEPLHWAANSRKSKNANREKSIAVSSRRVRFTKTTIQLGNRTLKGIRTGLHRNRIFRNEDGLLGNGLLSQFSVVTLDTRRGKLFLE